MLNNRSPSLTSQESYSAIIIADLVADVPMQSDNELRDAKFVKEEMNLAFERHLESPDAASIMTEKAKLPLYGLKANDSDISKGIILNTEHFRNVDSATKSEEKYFQQTNTTISTQPISEMAGFKYMSFIRKIAFGFSFIPSILFVLCFAVLLPCRVPSPCVEERWIKMIKDAETTSRLELSPNVVFSVLEKGNNSLVSLDATNGKELKKEAIPATAIYLNCKQNMKNEEKYCIVMDKTQNIHIFNSSNRELVWNPVPEGIETTSLPVLLPDCNGDGLEDIVVAISNTKMKVLYGKNQTSEIDYDCDSMPTRLIPWIRNNLSDIVFTCKKSGEERLVKVPWCSSDATNLPWNWSISKIDPSTGFVLHLTNNGLVIWKGDVVYMILPNREILWKFSSDTHPIQNRYILHGNFNGKNQQLALLSSDISSKFQVTLLNYSNGSVISTNVFNNSEAREIIGIQGTERDFALLLLKKNTKSSVGVVMEHIHEISTTIINYISNEKLNDTQALFPSDVSEELLFMDLDGSGRLHSIAKIDEKHDATTQIGMAATRDQESLNVFLLGAFSNATAIRSLKVLNWDISASKQSECSLKHQYSLRL